MLTVLTATQEGPAPEDVKAGWVALIIFLLLVGAVALLGFSLFKHLRISRESRDLGLYGDSTDSPGSTGSPDSTDDPATPGGSTQSS
ncbi:MAG: hypothetical protein JWN68_177 [Nocardioides sp.]|jgi:hypothetical protein|uniref:hypothetical protein n=1 Tax=Nocardioides sp. TaxID=35761 RepID=UPI00262A823A|nr:hypothetical protein [Nocardioides sp.]MCW2832224.1 hypothetical protein [Nocardioides sp.]